MPSSLETVVRPAVLPDIRPLPTQNLTGEPDDEQTEINSSGGRPIDFSHTQNVSWNKQEVNERSETASGGGAGQKIGRFVDILRVYKIKKKDGARDETNVDRTSFIDQEITTTMHLINEFGEHVVWRFTKPEVQFNMEIILRDVFKPG